jgi:hypothetical protein
VPGLARHFGDRLDRGGTRADDGHIKAREVDRFMWPATGEIGLAPEAPDAGEVGILRYRQASGCHHDGAGHERPLVGHHGPDIAGFVKAGGLNAGVEADVAAQVEFRGDVVQVGEDLGLRRVFFAPFPFLVEGGGEAVAVLHAFNVDPGARIAVPVPGAAEVGGGFDHDSAHVLLAQPVEHVEAGKTGSHHDGVKGCSGSGAHGLSLRARIGPRRG